MILELLNKGLFDSVLENRADDAITLIVNGYYGLFVQGVNFIKLQAEAGLFSLKIVPFCNNKTQIYFVLSSYNANRKEIAKGMQKNAERYNFN